LTKGEWSGALGVTHRTLNRWEDRPGFWDRVYEEARAILDSDHSEHLAALSKKAKGGDVTAIAKALAITGRHEEKKGGGVNIAIIQPVMHEAMAEIRGVVNDLIALYVPEADRSNARGYLAERVRELGARVDGEVVVEDGVFRPLLQDKKQRR